MYAVDVYAAVRQFVFVEGRSRREAASVFGLSRDTISKMCRFSAPPGYVRTKPPGKPKLGPFIPVIDAILAADVTAPPKQRHTAKRIFERLKAEHGFCWRLFGRARLCAHRPSPGARDLCAAGASARPRAGRFRRSDRGDRWGAPEAACVFHGPAAFGRAVHEGLSGGDHRGVSRRPCERLRASLAAFRSRFCTTTPSLRWRRSAATASASGRAPLADLSAIICFATGSAGPARATTRARSRDWSRMAAAAF